MISARHFIGSVWKSLVLVTSTGGILSVSAVFASAHVAPYDRKADGAKQIETALVSAKREGKRVLVQFGANWCVWCIRLHSLFGSDARIAARLKESYVVVLVDMDGGRNAAVNERYGKPTRFGLPAIVVLDAEGKALVTQDTEEFEEGDGHNPSKVNAFLEKWALKSR